MDLSKEYRTRPTTPTIGPTLACQIVHRGGLARVLDFLRIFRSCARAGSASGEQFDHHLVARFDQCGILGIGQRDRYKGQGWRSH